MSSRTYIDLYGACREEFDMAYTWIRRLRRRLKTIADNTADTEYADEVREIYEDVSVLEEAIHGLRENAKEVLIDMDYV